MLWRYLVDGLGLGVVRVEEANELRGAHFGRVRVHERRPLGGRGREPLRRRRERVWKTGDQKSLAVEWAPVGAKKCLVARVEILMGAEPTMTSFLVEDLDEVLELSD